MTSRVASTCSSILSRPFRQLSNVHPQRTCHLSTVSTSSRYGPTSPSQCWNTTSNPCKQPPRILKPSSGPHNPFCLSHPHSHPTPPHLSFIQTRAASTSRWVSRQKSDPFTKEAKLTNLKSRAAFKLLQINDRYRIFRPGMTVVDLGFAPGSWSQVAIDVVRPGLGRVVGVDIIPVVPPKGVNGLQGDFLSPHTQERVRELLRDESAGRARRDILLGGSTILQQDETGYIDRERAATVDSGSGSGSGSDSDSVKSVSVDGGTSEHDDKCVDVVLSDMSAPWEEITSGLSWKNSLSNPYYRLMNTSGNRFKDHAGSMDLCRSALYFAYETLKIGGHFVCKFYQGAEDKVFEKQLKAMFHKVHREKPESSRSESKEAFFVGIKRLAKVDRNAVFDEGS